MKIVFFSNYLNHHQIPLAEAFNSTPGVNYTFVAVASVPEFRKRLGYLEYQKPYLLEIGESLENKERAKQLAIEADVVIFLAAPLIYEYIIPRLIEKKLTFEYSERWFKKRFKLNILSPRLWKYLWFYHKYGRNANLYMLSAGAYVPNDFYFFNAYKKRCFKWGYFTKVDDDFEVEAPKQGASTSEITPFMWCARFLKLKHPELPVHLAARLKAKGYQFVIDMYGNGEELEHTKRLITRLGVEDCVNLCGNRPNEEILKEMRKHKIFLFTSDQNEGWGAVANEAMSNGCCIIGSNTIGSIPYLVKDGVNGLIYKSEDLDSLCSKVEKVLDDKDYLTSISHQAVLDMQQVWSPGNASKRLLTLVENLSQTGETSFIDGPCSKAEPIDSKSVWK